MNLGVRGRWPSQVFCTSSRCNVEPSTYYFKSRDSFPPKFPSPSCTSFPSVHLGSSFDVLPPVNEVFCYSGKTGKQSFNGDLHIFVLAVMSFQQ